MTRRLAFLISLAAVALTAAPGSASAQTYSQWNDAALDTPAGLAVDQKGNVYVANSGSGEIRKYTNTGTLITTFSTVPGGTPLQTPTGVAVDNPEDPGDDPKMYVADQLSGHVQELSPTGKFITDYGVFEDPAAVDVDAAGHVWVVDAGPANQLLVKFTTGGTLLNVYGKPGGGASSAAGEFNGPQDVSVDTDGDILVADFNNNRLQKLSPTGSQIWQTASGALSEPAGVAHDIDLIGSDLVDRLWVTAFGSDTFLELDDDGSVLQTLGGAGTGLGQFDNPWGIAADCADNVFISDSGNNRIQRYGTASTPPCTAPDNTVSPEVVGDATAGSGLALDPGTWTGSPTPRITYRWQRCSTNLASSCGDIAGQRGLTYAVTNADRGQRLRAVVVAANNQGIVTEQTDMTPPVPVVPVQPLPPAPPNPTPPPVVPPLPPVQSAKVKRTGIATFRVFCPATGSVDCRIRADVVGPGTSDSASSEAERAGMIVLARVKGRVRFGQTRNFSLRLTRSAGQLVRDGYRERAIMRVSVDGKRSFTSRIPINRRTAAEFGR